MMLGLKLQLSSTIEIVDRITFTSYELIGKTGLALNIVPQRFDSTEPLQSQWLKLFELPSSIHGRFKKKKNPGEILVKICLEAGYHVYNGHHGDFQPSANHMKKESIGSLQLTILGARGLPPMKKQTDGGSGTTDAYCVAVYGNKWVRTTTIINSQEPFWNEHCSWEIYDPCTVIKIGIFDDSMKHTSDDIRIGRVFIQLQTLELSSLCRWFDEICRWRNPLKTIFIHVLYLVFILYPKLILPSFFLSLSMIGLWNYRLIPINPPRLDARLSLAEKTDLDYLDEEFDTFPTSQKIDIVKRRYDQLRRIHGRYQTVYGDIATLGEKVMAIFTCADLRATSIFTIIAFVGVIFIYMASFKLVAILLGLYWLRHPCLRSKNPSILNCQQIMA
uniref:FT-interacting protein 7-like n=1 Tax=Erigeron canadensis TaxID=72917 RepID=UPI001CB950B6|nr:FT-interacting protein 7-like [Erigeron canadensis]